jgi:hypothetical protein
MVSASGPNVMVSASGPNVMVSASGPNVMVSEVSRILGTLAVVYIIKKKIE